MITLYLVKNIEKLTEIEEYISLDEDLHLKLQVSSYPIDCSLIGNIPMYGNINTFDTVELYDLQNICDEMIQYTWNVDEESIANNFFLKLHSICKRAIKENYYVVAIGD